MAQHASPSDDNGGDVKILGPFLVLAILAAITIVVVVADAGKNVHVKTPIGDIK